MTQSTNTILMVRPADFRANEETAVNNYFQDTETVNKDTNLLAKAEFDNAVKTENLLKIIPEKTNIKTYVLDCGHNGHWEKPTICAEIINTELLHNLPKHFLL